MQPQLCQEPLSTPVDELQQKFDPCIISDFGFNFDATNMAGICEAT